MTPEAFRADLAALALRQMDLARLLAHFSGRRPDPTKVNRWAGKGEASAVPDSAIALLAVLVLLPQSTRHQLYQAAGIKIRSVEK